MNYYNDNDPKSAAWLRELIDARQIPFGVVDEQSITRVQPEDLEGFTQCHFFAGIAGWSLALLLARWPQERPVWTGSCPCQPFSQAGKQKGTADERHLWPEFRRLIDQCRPPTIFGEQVASKLGRQCLAGVRSDLETMGYAVGAADLCAAGVGAPHIRQRLFWVAHNPRHRWKKWTPAGQQKARSIVDDSSGAVTLDNSNRTGRQQHRWQKPIPTPHVATECTGDIGSMEYAALPTGARLRSQCQHILGSSAWSNFKIIHYIDGKARRFEPGSFPLANGIPGRLGLLRGYGNAIVPPLAAEFIKSYLEVTKKTS